MPGTWPFTQEMKSPLRQASQVKSQPPNHPTPTRSPTFHVLTPSPTASTSPAISWPGARGNELPIMPITVSKSEWQTPHACTLTRTCPGPGSGISTSVSSNFSFAAGTRAIFMVATSGRLLRLSEIFAVAENLGSAHYVPTGSPVGLNGGAAIPVNAGAAIPIQIPIQVPALPGDADNINAGVGAVQTGDTVGAIVDDSGDQAGDGIGNVQVAGAESGDVKGGNNSATTTVGGSAGNGVTNVIRNSATNTATAAGNIAHNTSNNNTNTGSGTNSPTVSAT